MHHQREGANDDDTVPFPPRQSDRLHLRADMEGVQRADIGRREGGDIIIEQLHPSAATTPRQDLHQTDEEEAMPSPTTLSEEEQG